MVETRRSFLRGLGAILCAPAIVRASNLMAISPVPLPDVGGVFELSTGRLTYAEMQQMVQRTFGPWATVQIYQESPILMAARAGL